MKELLQNKTIAILCTLVLIVISIPYSAGRSLGKLRNPINSIFYTGIDNDNISIENDLANRVDLSFNFVTVAKKYLNENDNILKDTLAARDMLMKAGNPREKYLANQKLTETTGVLYDKLRNSTLSEQDEKYRDSIYASLKSRNSTIANDSVVYNKKAEEFNQRLNSFPGILAKMLNITKNLEIYGI